MDLLTQADLKRLSEAEGEWCVSLYLPTVRAGAEVQQNPIRLKNLMREAAEQLKAVGMRAPDAEKLLEPVQTLLNDADFWRNTSDGLAVFVGPEMFHTFRLPASFEEFVGVRQRFHIKPLLVMLSGDGRFCVLALSQDEIRVLEGTRNSVNEVPVDGIPSSLADAMKYDQHQRTLNRAVQGTRAVYHGGGAPDDAEAKNQILRYFQMVDRGLRDLLAEQTIPLVLAGVDYLLPIYHEANTYCCLLEQGITGNPETWSAKELHRRAWDVVKPYFEQAQADQRALYEEFAGRDDGRADNRVVDVVRAAVEGRVATLFVAKGVQKWGVYRGHSHKVHAHPTRQPGDQDLLDVAAVQTFLSGGTVYVVDQEHVPGGDVLAAVFRY